MYYILYEHDHENRANAMTGRLPQAQLVTGDVKEVKGMTTLIFWGHGTSGKLCGKTPAEAAQIVKDWLADNKKIDTVEILTCDARHAKTGEDSYVAQFRTKLGFKLRRKLTVKALPMRSQRNGAHGASILFADYKSKTWAYVTAADEQSLLFMRAIFKIVCERMFDDDAIKTAVFLTSPPPRSKVKGPAHNPFSKFVDSIAGIHTNDRMRGFAAVAARDVSHRFGADLLKAFQDPAFREAFVNSRKYSMNYGDFDHLRDQLVVVK